MGWRSLSGLALSACIFACATEGEQHLEAELIELQAEVTRAIGAVDESIKSQTYEMLGESVGRVESAAYGLAAIESREELHSHVRIQAALVQARAWDDLARTLFQPEDESRDDAAPALQDSLRQKALPARVAALAAYERTRGLLCEYGLRDDPVMIESLDGIARFSGRTVEAPCD